MADAKAQARQISIHALREEGDPERSMLVSKRISDFYPRPPRGGRRIGLDEQIREDTISIHALREEGDSRGWTNELSVLRISIHALREEGDSKNRDKISIFKQIIQHSARI